MTTPRKFLPSIFRSEMEAMSAEIDRLRDENECLRHCAARVDDAEGTISSLREASEDCARRGDDYAAFWLLVAAGEIERLLTRLEIWPVDPATGEFDKSIVLDEGCDGIAARDETIYQLQEQIDRLKRRY